MEFALAVIGLGIAFVVALFFGIALTWAVVMLTMRMLGLVTRGGRLSYPVGRQRPPRRARVAEPFPEHAPRPDPILIADDSLFSRLGAFSIRAIAGFILLVFLAPLLMPLLIALFSVSEAAFALIANTFPWSLFLLILIGHQIYLGLHRYYRRRAARGSQPFWFFQRSWTYPSPTTDSSLTDGIEILEVRLDNEAVCRVCGTSIESDVVLCRRCHTPHHHDCWHYAGRCSTYACGERRYIKPTPPTVKPPLINPPDEQPPHSHWQNMGQG
jgi:ribosomal protein L40E